MEKRKEAIIEALIAQTNAILDAHLVISTQEIPKSFRDGLKISGLSEPKSRDTRSEEKSMSPAKSDVSEENADVGDKSVNDFQVIEDDANEASQVESNEVSPTTVSSEDSGVGYPVVRLLYRIIRKFSPTFLYKKSLFSAIKLNF